MTRILNAGRVKTRLIPVLGPDGAAALHSALLRKTLLMANVHARQSAVELEVRFTGGASDSAKSLVEERMAIWREQRGSDLGDRMHLAIETARGEGATAVIVIGTDCPDLSTEVLTSAWKWLDRHGVVLGPADDGGYYLIGMKLADARLFDGVDWGTEHVLRQTQNRCRNLGKSLARLPPLSDVDEPEDLIVCRRFDGDFADCLLRRHAGLLSIVIPTRNEVGKLEAALSPIHRQPNCEILIADGGSADGTVDLARKLGCRVITANRGRGRQMNAGAGRAFALPAGGHATAVEFSRGNSRDPRWGSDCGSVSVSNRSTRLGTALRRVGHEFAITIPAKSLWRSGSVPAFAGLLPVGWLPELAAHGGLRVLTPSGLRGVGGVNWVFGGRRSSTNCAWRDSGWVSPQNVWPSGMPREPVAAPVAQRPTGPPCGGFPSCS
jgi:rSAM/selenodomain-associated transferase 1